MRLKRVEGKTRRLFHGLHKQQAADDKTFKRLVGLLSPEYLRLPKNYFEGKVCLDAGCGSNANATFSMLTHGAEKVCAFDLDKSIFAVAPKKLSEFKGRYELKTGSVHRIPYEDDTFDLVHCSGVLHHSTDIYKGLAELARVTKPGGYMYIMVHGKGGIMRDFMGVLRTKYQSDKGFKRQIDTLSVDDLANMWEFIVSAMAAQGDTLGKQIPKPVIKELLNNDLVLTIQDRIAAPLYTQSSEKELKKWFTSHGFTNVRRVSRYPKLFNVRRFLAPLYYHYDNRFARFFYGDGDIQLIAKKK
jgi:ubiquinone/menaquinone biosynthesis C-methylase UbiE